MDAPRGEQEVDPAGPLDRLLLARLCLHWLAPNAELTMTRTQEGSEVVALANRTLDVPQLSADVVARGELLREVDRPLATRESLQNCRRPCRTDPSVVFRVELANVVALANELGDLRLPQIRDEVGDKRCRRRAHVAP